MSQDAETMRQREENERQEEEERERRREYLAREEANEEDYRVECEINKENRKQLYRILIEFGYKHLRDGTLDEEGHSQKEIFENPVGRVTLFYEHDTLVYIEAK